MRKPNQDRSLVIAAVLAAGLLAGLAWLPRPGGAGSAAAREADDVLELVFTYGSEKEEWVKEVTATFNAGKHTTEGGKVIHVEAFPMGSGQCVDEILDTDNPRRK